MSGEGLGAPSTLEQASRGCPLALSALLDQTLALGDDGTVRPVEALACAELLARMAASHGELVDFRRLASVLMMRANFERRHGSADHAATLDAEALGILDIAADDGDELAGRVLAEAASVMPAAPFELLRTIKAEGAA
jgi:hypothetical protein